MTTEEPDEPIPPLVVPEAAPIAHFDVVPRQVITGSFELGVVAFHKDGIDRVDFRIGDGENSLSLSSDQFTLNPRTNVEEYWVTLNPAGFNDGLITITANVYAKGGAGQRELTINLYVDNSGTAFADPQYFVSPTTGNDENGGTRAAPFQTIQKALYSLKGEMGGRVILMEETTYLIGEFGKHSMPGNIDRWISIEADGGLNRDNVIISSTERQIIRFSTSHLAWSGVSFDMSKISQFYDAIHWFNNCRFYSPDGWLASYASHPQSFRMDGEYYATNSRVEEMLYGFTYGTLLRNCYLYKISGDALQGTLCVLNTTVDTIDGELLEHHSDIYQMFGAFENILIYNMDAININACQTFFLEPTYYSALGNPQHALSNAAFVNCTIYHEPTLYHGNPNAGGPPFSQMISIFNHVLFINVKLPGQQYIFRNDIIDNNQTWNATDIHFNNVELHYQSYNRYCNESANNYEGLPSGVSFQNVTSAAQDYTGMPAGYSAGDDFGRTLPVIP